MFHTLSVQVSLRSDLDDKGEKYFEKIVFATFVHHGVFAGYLGLGNSAQMYSVEFVTPLLNSQDLPYHKRCDYSVFIYLVEVGTPSLNNEELLCHKR